LPASDLSLLVEAAHASGEIARRFWQQSPGVWHKADNAGPVTEADLEIDAMLHGMLRDARPDYGWLSEETEDDTARLKAEHVFIIDPIDGTRAFIEGARGFAHSLAVARGGDVTAAAVYLRMPDLMFTATCDDAPAMLNGAPIAANQPDVLDGATVLATKANFAPACWPHGLPPVERHFRSSLAYRLCLVAQGRFDAMLTLRPTWEWDVAAGSLIARKAGAVVSDQAGGAPRFNNRHPQLNGMIAAGRLMHDALLARLTPTTAPG